MEENILMDVDDIEKIKKKIIDNDIKLLRINSYDNLNELIISSSTNTLDFAELLILSFDMIKTNLGYIKIKELTEYINKFNSEIEEIREDLIVCKSDIEIGKYIAEQRIKSAIRENRNQFDQIINLFLEIRKIVQERD